MIQSPIEGPIHQPFIPPRAFSGSPCGGRIGSEPEHFQVEEVPAYPLCGEGEHLFLWIEKKGLTTTEVAKRIARASGLRERDIGYAGMKDKNAVTRQWFSLCISEDSLKDNPVASWTLGADVRICESKRHKNKLRTGHLIGNRFRITLVDVPHGSLEKANLIAEFLEKGGLPNYFGPQRFGREGRNLDEAFKWLQRTNQPAPPATEEQTEPTEPGKKELGSENRRRSRKKGRRPNQSRFENKLLPSVLQSEIFNRYTSARLALNQPLILGEIVRLDQAAKCFVVEDLAAERPRKESGDLHLMGPMPGPKTLQAQADALELENQAVKDAGLDASLLKSLENFAPGARRDLLLHPENLQVSQQASDELLVEFTLPAGAYATQLVREFSGADWAEPRISITSQPTPRAKSDVAVSSE